MAVGTRGRVDLVLQNAYPIVQVQIRFDTQILGQLDGAELRDIVAIGFSVPRMPGDYNLTVYAKDSVGCEVVTTVPRLVTIQ